MTDVTNATNLLAFKLKWPYYTLDFFPFLQRVMKLLVHIKLITVTNPKSHGKSSFSLQKALLLNCLKHTDVDRHASYISDTLKSARTQ